jgi:hypothetical protein
LFLTEFGGSKVLLHVQPSLAGTAKLLPAFAVCRPSLAGKKNAASLRRFSRAQ